MKITNEVLGSIDESAINNQNQLLLVDINKLSELTSISQRYLEEHILIDPRIKQFERKRHRKRWWIWDYNGRGVKEEIINIINDW